MKFVIPIGPTDNRRHVIARGGRRFVDAPEYRDWKELCVTLLKNQLRRIPGRWKPYSPTFDLQMEYHVTVFLPNKQSDAANYDKGLRDVLTTALVWEDDKWCLPVFERIQIDKSNPRIEVEV